MRNPLIAQRIFNVPLLIHPAKLDAIIAGLGPRVGVDVQRDRLVMLDAVPTTPGLFTAEGGERREPGYRVLAGGVAVLDIFGVLAHRGGINADSSYVLGYQEIARRLDAALADPTVRAIVLNVDSPGGEVAGAFDLAERVRAAASIKPVHAIAGDLAASAAYLIASAAESVSITRTGYAGSVGVVMRHVDWSRALDADGITVTQIFAGARKVDGNPFEPLPDDVRARFAADIGRVYDLFVAAVAAHRGLTADHVRETEAATYMGGLAVERRLVDRIETPDALIDRLRQRAAGTSTPRTAARAHQEGQPMSTTENRPAAEEAAPTYTAAQLDAARAEGRADGATAERERIALITTASEAEGRLALAQHLAFETDMAAEAALKALAAAPLAAPPGRPSRLAAAMAVTRQPNVGDGGGEQDPDGRQAIAAGWGRAFARVAPATRQ